MEKALLKSLCIGLILISTASFAQTGDTIIGNVYYHNSYPMSNVTAHLTNSNGTVIATDVTGSNGQYEFYNVAPGSYTVTFSTTATPGGVNLSDAFTIFLYCMGYVPLNDIQLLAADVNGNGSVTLADYTYMMINYLTQGNMFPIGPWVFQSVTTSTYNRTGTGLSTGGSSSGDVNGNFVPTKNGNQIFTYANLEAVTHNSSKGIPLPVKVSSQVNVGGMFLAFRIPDGLKINSVTGPMPNVRFYVDGDILRVTWMDTHDTEMDESVEGMILNQFDPVINIDAEISEGNFKGKQYSLELLGESHFISNTGEILQGMQLVTPLLSIAPQAEFSINTYPNPFTEKATFNVRTPGAGNLQIFIFDSNGRLVSEISEQATEAGVRQLNFDGSSLGSGIYHYKVSFSGDESINYSGSIIKSR